MSARHVDPDDGSFRRSLGHALLVGLAVAVVPALVTGFLTRLGDPGGGTTALGDATETIAVTPATPGTGASPGDSPGPTEPAPSAGSPTAPGPAPTEVTGPAPTEATERAPATGGGAGDATSDPSQVTVQVLDGTVGAPGATEDAVRTLRDLGYTVVVVNTAKRAYERTTVVATPGHEAEAEALGERDPRFDFVDPALQLSPAVDLHVIVGADWTASP